MPQALRFLRKLIFSEKVEKIAKFLRLNCIKFYALLEGDKLIMILKSSDYKHDIKLQLILTRTLSSQNAEP